MWFILQVLSFKEMKMLMFIIFYNLVTRKKKRKKGVVFGAPENDDGIQCKLERILKSVIFFSSFLVSIIMNCIHWQEKEMIDRRKKILDRKIKKIIRMCYVSREEMRRWQARVFELYFLVQCQSVEIILG